MSLQLAETTASVAVVIAPAAQQPKPRTHAPPVDHALKAYALQRDRMVRAASAMAASARLFSGGMDAGAWDELWEMGAEAHRRMAQLQNDAVQDWFAWFRYADQIEGANTMSKLAEREYNVLAQATQLMGEHSTAVMSLMENIEVGFLYWLHEKTK